MESRWRLELRREKKLFTAIGLVGLAGIILFCSSVDVLADKSTAEAIKRVEDGLASRTVSSIEELAQRLRSEQAVYRMLMPPSAHFTLRQPCGMMVFDPAAFPEAFTSALIGETIYESPVYTIILIEDPVTREVVIANVDGKEIAAVEPEADYNPWWYLERQYPGVYSGLYSEKEIWGLQDEYDPSHIQITLTLLPADFVKTYARAVGEERVRLADEQAAAELKNPKLKKGVMMRYQSTGMTNLEIVALAMVTNGMKLTLAYPDDFTNRVDFFTCPELIAGWWDLAVNATNVSISTNFIEWVDVNSSAHPFRFYNAGNADLDSDGDTLTDAREKLMYHTNSSTNDTDGDGLHDDYELFTSFTDPNIGDTNKPDAWIYCPVNESRKVWLP